MYVHCGIIKTNNMKINRIKVENYERDILPSFVDVYIGCDSVVGYHYSIDFTNEGATVKITPTKKEIEEIIMSLSNLIKNQTT